MRKSFSGFRKETKEHLVLDAGLFLKNFTYTANENIVEVITKAKADGNLLGATKGGGEFSAVAAIRQIEVDGVKGRAKGLETIDSWEVYLKANVLEATCETIKAALCAAKVDSESDTTYNIITGKGVIDDEDYLENITWVGNLSGSDKPVIVQVYNALNTDGLKLTVQDKNEATIPMTFHGHYTHDDLENPPFKIYYPKGDTATNAVV